MATHNRNPTSTNTNNNPPTPTPTPTHNTHTTHNEQNPRPHGYPRPWIDGYPRPHSVQNHPRWSTIPRRAKPPTYGYLRPLEPTPTYSHPQTWRSHTDLKPTHPNCILRREKLHRERKRVGSVRERDEKKFKKNKKVKEERGQRSLKWEEEREEIKKL